MKTIFAKSPWERPAVIPPRLGQFSNPYASNPYSWNTYGEGTPQQRLLRQAEESMNQPPPETPQQRLLRQAQQSMNQPPAQTPQQRLLRESAASMAEDCYTCSSGSDVQAGVNAQRAASLRAKGYLCRKDECAGFGQEAFNSSNYSGLLNAPAPTTVSNITSGYGGYDGSVMNMMAQALPQNVPVGQPLVADFPVLPVALAVVGVAVLGKLILG